MNIKKITTIAVLLFVTLSLSANDNKKPLSHDDYDQWKSVQNYKISNDGKWVLFEINPQRGDSALHLTNPSDNFETIIERGGGGQFSFNSKFMACNIEPQFDTIRQMRLDEVKKDKMPKDTLGIFVFEHDSLMKIGRVKSFKLPEKGSSWIAYLHEKELPAPKDTTEVKDSTKVEEEETAEKKEEESEAKKEEEKSDENKDEKKSKKKYEGTKFVIYNPETGDKHEFENVESYAISDNGKLFSFVSVVKDSVDSVYVYSFDTEKQEKSLIWDNIGAIKGLTIDEQGKQAAFAFSTDTSKRKLFSLHYWEKGQKRAASVVDSSNQAMPDEWTVAEKGRLGFSEDGTKLYFATVEKPEFEKKDTLLPEEKAKLDVWNWKDPYLQTMQLHNLKKDKSKTYKAVYRINDKKMIQIETEEIPDVKTLRKGNSDKAIGLENMKYRQMVTWEYPDFKDIYMVDLKTGSKKLILEAQQYEFDVSPDGNYIAYYRPEDSTWKSLNVKTEKSVVLTKGMKEIFCDEENDVPAEAYPYGVAGWTEKEAKVLIYDKYDIWAFDPAGKEKPINLTNAYGRKNDISFRYMKLDKEEEFIPAGKESMLKAKNKVNMQEGFWASKLQKAKNPEKLMMDDYWMPSISKAKDVDQYIFRKGNYYIYPDLYYTEDFEDTEKISDANPQQKDYLWGTVEMIEWTDMEGIERKGLLYKPDNFDPNKKYPMIVYFYERYTESLHRHYVPKPTASIIYPNLYASNDYVVFIPDIYYENGFPGKSAYNAIMSGTHYLINKGFIDKDRMGLQGQSWGGYQTAFLVTQTNLFSAAMAGAPVSNMTSAYGGIRWGSGMCRAFQYEVTQSRIGGTLWEKPELYIENSPLFFADRVETPLLIMHNDGDGAVPWYQGIEYFNALRRLQKPVWMLNYNGDEHNLMKRANRMDLSIRMMQFFDHFLKDSPAPEWLECGIPAVDKGDNYGLEPAEKK